MINDNLTENIIIKAIKVHKILGPGFLEKVYENALKIELLNLGYSIKQQKPLKVYYEENLVGVYFADIIVNDEVIVELKASVNLNNANKAQLLNYLKATNKERGLLLNFGTSKLQINRVVNNFKEIQSGENN